MEGKMHRNVTPITVLHRSKNDDADDVAQQCSLAKQSSILLVTRSSRLAEPVMDYAVNVADRMNCKILATYVNTLPLFGSGDVSHKQFASAIEQNAIEFKEKAVTRGVDFEYVQESGKISKIISRLCRIMKRIEFVLIDQGIKIEEAAFASPVPVFNIVCADSRTGKTTGNRLANKKLQEKRDIASTNKKSYRMKSIVFGTIIGVLYAALFSNLELVMQYFTKGGMYLLLPVASAAVFLYLHVCFFSSFRSALGIEGAKVTCVKKVEESKSVDKRSDPKPRVQTGA